METGLGGDKQLCFQQPQNGKKWGPGRWGNQAWLGGAPALGALGKWTQTRAGVGRTMATEGSQL